VDVVQAAIPLFFALIGLELVVARVRGERVYRLADSISDLSCGILSQLAGIAIALGTIAAFAWVGTDWSVQRFLPVPAWIDRSPFGRPEGGVDAAALASWAAVFCLDDFAYYWMHRASHVVNLLWAGHVVHHSSEEFNLTVALRQSSLHGFMSWLFYLPLAVLGIPPTMWVVCHGLNLVYQFWIHTREIGRLGPVEAVLNTPSHHRVHHGVNPEYQDRNFAGALIVWDRLFGTFEPERAEPVYGITKPLATWNPIAANLHAFGDIGRNLRASASWGERWRSLFGHPGWRPSALGAPVVPGPVSPATFRKYEPPAAPGLKAYALVQFTAVLLGAVALLFAAPRLDPWALLAGGFAVALSLGNIGGILEARSWAGVAEPARLAAVALAALYGLVAGLAPPAWLALAAVLALGSLVWAYGLRPLLTSRDTRAVVAM
jgi:sterol desaturase/sphingolipid hydroxylase (fatty acid hydroxylase superfamily)